MVSASWAYNGGFNSLSCLGLPPTRAQAFGSKDGWPQEDTGGQDRTRKDIITVLTTNKHGSWKPSRVSQAMEASFSLPERGRL